MSFNPPKYNEFMSVNELIFRLKKVKNKSAAVHISDYAGGGEISTVVNVYKMYEEHGHITLMTESREDDDIKAFEKEMDGYEEEKEEDVYVSQFNEAYLTDDEG